MTERGATVGGVARFADDYRERVFDRALGRVDLDRRRLPEADPASSLAAFFLLYGFDADADARGGDATTAYRRHAVAALERADGDAEVDPDGLWRLFAAECERSGADPDERANRGVLCGMARLANRTGNLFRWVGRAVTDGGGLLECDRTLDAVDAVDSETARAFLRDAVWVCGVTEFVRPQERYLLQPLARPVARVAAALWPELRGGTDDVLADQIVTACAERGVSTVAFNQGAWYLGREAGGDPAELRDRAADRATD